MSRRLLASLINLAAGGRRVVITLIVLAIAAGACAGTPDFDRDIRPILSDKCFQCHGPDAARRKADLRLDTIDGPKSEVVAGKPDESELIRRIESSDDEERMPPPASKVTLAEEQKELLRRWVAAGAVVTEHWSFLPLPERVEVPVVADESWPHSPLDRFVLARLEAENLRPSPQSDPLRLLRRVTLDLTGLPPTAEEVRDFETAASKDLDAALASAVDRLLASPAFGEHMAVAWLDAARYADSHGYQADQLNTQWPYRDWVVRAINDNLPYDQFLTWQLAGDLLPNATKDQILATAFNRIHRMTSEGGSIAEEWLAENAADRVHTLGGAILGLTLECARCHDHKYDPITTRDFYSLTAFFNSIDENGMYDRTEKAPTPSLMLPTPEQEKQLADARQAIAAAEAAVAECEKNGNGRFERWLRDSPRPPVDRDLVGYFAFDGDLNKMSNQAAGGKGEAKGQGLKSVPGARGQAVRFDGDVGVEISDLMTVDRWDPFSLDFGLRDNARSALPVVLAQRSYGSDIGYNGFDLTIEGGYLAARIYRVWPGNGIGVRAERPIAVDRWQHVTVTYDGSSDAAGLKLYLDGAELPTRILRNRIHKSASYPAFGDGRFTLGARFRDRGFKDGEIDELRIFERDLTPLEVQNLNDGKAIATAVGDANDNRASLQEFYFAAIDDETRKLSGDLRDARRKFVTLEDGVQEVSVMEELPEPRPTYILPRGAYDAPKTEKNRVQRDAFERFLTPFQPDAPRNRLGLARWLTDPRHPLTARVAVNRLWANFFGRGFVATPENFGQQGAAPTHPELLDWLARDIVEHGWDVKRMCREIVLSATYRQDSRRRPELEERDPENLLLARGASRRLSAEEIRDVALAASGLLVRDVGGPPVSPYQPGPDLWREANSMTQAYQQSTGKGLHRRSLYSVWKRTAPLPNMLAFDAPTREVCVVSRSRTDTPLQALVLLNDVQFVEAARALAAEASRAGRNEQAWIADAFVRLAGRHPTANEAKLLADVYNDQRKSFSDGEQDADKFLHEGEAQGESPLAPADLSALTATCQVILNLDATVYER